MISTTIALLLGLTNVCFFTYVIGNYIHNKPHRNTNKPDHKIIVSKAKKMKIKAASTLLFIICIGVCNGQFKGENITNTGTLSLDTFAIKNYMQIDSVVTSPDGVVQFYYSNDIWRERYLALAKMYSYCFLRIPYHNKRKFKAALKKYKELLQ